MLELPHWYPELEALAKLPRIDSGGCATIVNGNAPCSVNQFKDIYESALKKYGLYKGPLSADEISMARYIATEVGSGTPSEKVAVAEAGKNRARMWGISVDQLLRLRQKSGHPNRGFYGPIHGTSSDCAKVGKSSGCAPYGRWAGTKKDPKPQDLVIARMVLRGETGNFAKGADDQIGPSAGEGLGFGADWGAKRIKSQAEKRSYWVGLLPGVNHRRTFLFKTMKGVSPTSPQGKAMVENALKWVGKTPNWGGLQIASKPFFSPSMKSLAFVGAAGAVLGLILWQRHSWLNGPLEKPQADYLVFKLKGCEACENFVPEFEKTAREKGLSYEVIDSTDAVERPESRSGILANRILDDYKVDTFPTVVKNDTGQRWLGPEDPSNVFGVLKGLSAIGGNLESGNSKDV